MICWSAVRDSTFTHIVSIDQCAKSFTCFYLCIQEICRQWEAKPESEKRFDPFYSSVKAVAFSTGTKLKTRVQVLNKVGTTVCCPMVAGSGTSIQWSPNMYHRNVTTKTDLFLVNRIYIVRRLFIIC